MKEIATINLVDAQSRDRASAIVRAAAGQIFICLSSMQDGDVEVAFGLEEAEALSSAIEEAIRAAEGFEKKPGIPG